MRAGHCEDCRFWQAHSSWLGKRHWMECERIEGDVHDVPDVGEAGAAIFASVSDDTGLDTRLVTGPLFGCTEFSAK